MRFIQHSDTFFGTGTPRQRLRWLWRSIGTMLRTPGSAQGRGQLAEFLFEVLRYIWKHFLIIVLLLLPVLLIVGMPQGRDLILNLLHSSAQVGMPGYVVRVMWFLLMLGLLAYAIWAIPGFYQRKEAADQRLAETGNAMPSWLRARSTSSDFLRVLAVLPMLFYGWAFIWVIRVEQVHKVLYWCGNGLLGLLILLYAVGVVYGWRKLRHVGWLILLVMFIIPLGFSALLDRFPDKPEFAYAVLGNGLLLISLLVFILFHRWERAVTTPDQPQLKAFLDKWSDRWYYAALALVTLGAIVLSLWRNTLCMTTIPVLVFFTAAYVLLIHLGLYLFMKVKATGKLIMLGVSAVIAAFIFFRPSQAHYVYLVPRSEEQPMLELDTFISHWVERQEAVSADSMFTVYLVAGEGGGSRAGFWTTRMLTLLDSVSNQEFSNKLLALSTVSGSSAGASAWLKWIKVREDEAIPLRPAQEDSINHFLARLVFSNNFVTGGIIDLLTRDLVQSANGFTWRRRNNRNLRLQEEENLGFMQALRRRPLRVGETYRPLPPRTEELELGGDIGTIPNYHFLPLSSLYYRPDGGIDTRMPLIFFNTTHMQTGRRGVAAPVRLDTTRFFHAMDVVAEVEAQTGKTLALGTANNLSELFPVFSAFSYLDGVGNFMDGGSYENKGLTTILEVRETLREKLAVRGYDAVRIVVLALENGNALSEADRRKWQEPVHQLPAMISQAATQPFEAHTAAARARAGMLLRNHPRDTILFLSLAQYAPYVMVQGKQDTTRRMDFPLARDLSASTVDSMEVAARKALQHILPLLRLVDPATFAREIKIEGNAQ